MNEELCDCSAADFCPAGKTGSERRCTKAEREKAIFDHGMHRRSAHGVYLFGYNMTTPLAITHDMRTLCREFPPTDWTELVTTGAVIQMPLETNPRRAIEPRYVSQVFAHSFAAFAAFMKGHAP